MSNKVQFKPRRRNRLLGCIALILGMPLVCGVILWVVFSSNNRIPDIVIPTPSLPPNNAYDDFVRAGTMAKAMTHPSPYSVDPRKLGSQSAAAFAACAQEAEPILAVLHSALAKPCMVPPTRSAFDLGFPKAALLRELSRLTSGAAEHYWMVGQNRRSAEILFDALEMGVRIRKGANLIIFLVSVAVQAIAERQIERLIPRLSVSDLEYAARRMDTISSEQSPFADIISEEKYSTAAIWLEMLRDPSAQGLRGAFNMARQQLLASEDSPVTWRDRVEILKFALANKTRMLNDAMAAYDQLAAESRKSYVAATSVQIPDTVMAMGVNLIPTTRSKFVAQEAILSLFRLEVALRRYRLDYGRYPESLALLAPHYLREIPQDPFGGSATAVFHYRKGTPAKGFLLYSVGPDMKDDKGMPEKSPGTGSGDIVSGSLWPKKKIASGSSRSK